MLLAYYAVAKPLATYLALRFGAVAQGVENIPRSGPIIAVGNHQKEFDGILVLWGIRRRTRTIVKSDNENPLALFLLSFLADMFTINRNSSDYGALRKARKVLRRGGAICMFPSAHRTIKVGGFHPGVVGLARSTEGVQIVPFGITHAEGLGVGTVVRNLHRGAQAENKPTIRFGEPFQLAPLPPAEARRQRDADLDFIRGRVLDLLPAELEGENTRYTIERSTVRAKG
ncbi:MAG TPA: lysophospholipid acyltransferase family protein [Candidatus Nanoarchaeia archaeon]